MLLAFDDTDGPNGGCTTHALFQVLAALTDLAPRGMPRLVRLNPNVPWKTRGNGAVCVELVRPTGPHVVVGEWQGMEMRAYPDGEPVPADDDILDAVWHVLKEISQADSSPAAVLLDNAPSPLHYWHAVRAFVEPEAAVTYAKSADVMHRAEGDGRALIGCLGAAAWPGPSTSYEFIAYREPARWGTKRMVTPQPLQGLDKAGVTFHTEDVEEDVLCCVPNTPCPVLFGLRGTDPERLLQTARSTTPLAAAEELQGWIIWASNQASGDHVSPIDKLANSDDGMTVKLSATVELAPQTTTGGHVTVGMTDSVGVPFTSIAFEPTKSFRRVVRQLLPGDLVEVVGAFADGAIRLESMQILSCVNEKVSNPMHCNRPMQSRGANQGYKCRECQTVAAKDAAKFRERSNLQGHYEVPVIARRHLHRPVNWEGLSAPPPEVI